MNTKLKVSTKKFEVKHLLRRLKAYSGIIWETGQVISVKDGVAKISGLLNVLSGEMVMFSISNLKGMVLSLEHNTISVVIFGNDKDLKQGDRVYCSYLILNISLSLQLFGRVLMHWVIQLMVVKK